MLASVLVKSKSNPGLSLVSTSMIVYISDPSLLKVIEVGTLKALSRFLNLSRSFIASRVMISPLALSQPPLLLWDAF